MAGVRIQHPTGRNVRYTVVEPQIPYGVPYVCTPVHLGGCGATHLFKTHHLNLDEAGAVIVGDVLFERIRSRLLVDGFRITNEVAKPPPITLGFKPGNGVWGDISIIRSPNSKEPL